MSYVSGMACAHINTFPDWFLQHIYWFQGLWEINLHTLRKKENQGSSFGVPFWFPPPQKKNRFSTALPNGGKKQECFFFNFLWVVPQGELSYQPDWRAISTPFISECNFQASDWGPNSPLLMGHQSWQTLSNEPHSHSQSTASLNLSCEFTCRSRISHLMTSPS